MFIQPITMQSFMFDSSELLKLKHLIDDIDEGHSLVMHVDFVRELRAQLNERCP
jgi:hypothetical protein